MTRFDEKDWLVAKEILKHQHYYVLYNKWRDLGEDEFRFLDYLNGEREAFKQQNPIKKHRNKQIIFNGQEN